MQSTYCITIVIMFITGLICQKGVPWYQIVPSLFCFVTAGILIACLAYLDDEDEEEDEFYDIRDEFTKGK